MHDLATSRRRDRSEAVPANLNQVLSHKQKFMLHRMSSYGWLLAFVRRSSGRSPVVVLYNPARNSYCTLEENGAAIRDPAIPMRNAMH